MKVTREEASPREVILNIELESTDVQPFLDSSYDRVANRIQIPGFRPGRAPRFLVENYVSREAMVRDSLDAILQQTLDRAIEDESLDIFGQPDVELLEVDPVSYKAVVPLEPVVQLQDLDSIHLEPESVEVTEEQVDQVMEQLRYDAAPWEPADRTVKYGDLLNLNVEGTVEGKTVAEDKGVDYIPSQDNLRPLPGFSVYLEGMSKDQTKEFTLPVPEDDTDAIIAGKECRFTVKVLEIKEKILPALDDEFAKGVGDGHDSLEALRASTLEDLTGRVERAAQLGFQERCFEEVIKNTSFEVSELTTNREIDRLLEEQAQAVHGRQADVDTYIQNAGKSREELREELRPTAQDRLTRYLVVRKLAQDDNIEVSPEEIDAEIETLASGSSEYRDSLRQAFSTENARSSIGNAILTRKVFERLAQRVQLGFTSEGSSSEGAEGEEATQGEGEASTPSDEASTEGDGAEQSALPSP